MSVISDYRASSGSLTSPSPSRSPTPAAVGSSRKLTSPSKTAGLDSSSELSELTEDEQDASRASAHSDSPHDASSSSRKKRGGIVPAPMWGWAYKAAPGRKPSDSEEPTSAISKISNQENAPNISMTSSAKGPIEDDPEEEEDVTPHKDDPPPPDPETYADDGGERLEDAESEEEIANETKKAVPPALTRTINTRESSPALTEDFDDADDEDRRDLDEDQETESSVAESEDEEALTSPVEEEEAALDVDVDGDDAPKNAETASVVPAAPAGSSIMAGQQLIKTPSPSTSPEPEEGCIAVAAIRIGAPMAASEKTVKCEHVEAVPDAEIEAEVTVENENEDDIEIDKRTEADIYLEAEAEAEAEVEAEAEEAELDLQPAHRAEALDVLAQVELRFALVREALYVEKMEDLAMEEALILQGIHPEMTHLQTELQLRHDKRLELAEKKRRCEDDHVSLMRRVEEGSIWSWWKFERDDLQVSMFAESNRKRRRLEREKRTLERPPPVQRVPLPPPTNSRMPLKKLTAHELAKFVSLDANRCSNPKRKHKELAEHGCAYPTLSVLTAQEIQSDLQYLSAPRARAYHTPLMGDIGQGIGVAPPYEHYIDYNAPPGVAIPPSHASFSHNLPPGPMPIQHPYTGPLPPNGHAYPHQPQACPPMTGVHPGNPRAMPGPGAPPPSAMSGYHVHGVHARRTPSPPPMSYEHGMPPYGTSGPSQAWAPVLMSASAGAGPSKQPQVNGYAKEHQRRPSSVKDGVAIDGRDRELKPERERNEKEKTRERSGLSYENAVREMPDDHGRFHAQQVGMPPGSQHPHRHTSMHQSLQGVPHHHHFVHHRHNVHHHHPHSLRQNPAGPPLHNTPRPHELDRHMHVLDREPISRHRPPTIEQINLLPKAPSQYWKEEQEPRDRDRGRSTVIPPAPPPMAQLGLPPERDRPPFVMTPSQVMQPGVAPRSTEGSNGPGRREPWLDEASPHGHGRARYESTDMYQHGAPPPLDGPARLHMHSRQGSNGIGIGSNNSPRPRNGTLASPPPTTGPGIAYPALHSPSRLPLVSSVHASPRGGTHASTPKGPARAISPLPAKSLPPPPTAGVVGAGYTMGPGTLGPVGNGPGSGSRLGTPGLAGPGTRPDIPPNGHGHSHLGLGGGHSGHGHGASAGTGATTGSGASVVGGGGLYPGLPTALAGPAQPLIPLGASSESSHITPPKMTVVHLGNGS